MNEQHTTTTRRNLSASVNTRLGRIQGPTPLPTNTTNPTTEDRRRDLALLCEAHGLTPLAVDPAADDPSGRTLAVLLTNADLDRLTRDLVDLRITERGHTREVTLTLLTGPWRLYATEGL